MKPFFPFPSLVHHNFLPLVCVCHFICRNLSCFWEKLSKRREKNYSTKHLFKWWTSRFPSQCARLTSTRCVIVFIISFIRTNYTICNETNPLIELSMGTKIFPFAILFVHSRRSLCFTILQIFMLLLVIESVLRWASNIKKNKLTFCSFDNRL